MTKRGTPGARPTVRDVAARAGVSHRTVSNVLNNPARVRSGTRARVEQAIVELGYERNDAARSLTSRRTRTIALAVGRTGHEPAVIDDPFLRALVQAASARDYRILVVDRGLSPQAEVDGLHAAWRRGAVDAAVLTNTQADDPRPTALMATGLPFVAFGAPWGVKDARYDWVDVDGAAGTAAAVEHLAELGHRRIAFIGWEADRAGGDERLRGWREAMTARRLGAEWVARIKADDIDAAQVATTAMFGRPNPPTALVAASDTLALGVIRGLQATGLTPGLDVAVVGFDDSIIAQLSRPALTSLRQPLDQVARFLVERIEALGVWPPADPQTCLFPPTLVVRTSSGGWREPE